jgi:hypothetical protein
VTSPLGDSKTAWGAIMRILVHRVTDELRHNRGIAYEVDWSGVRVDHQTGLTALWADGREGNEAEVAKGLWRELRTIAIAPPTDEELAHDRAELAVALADSRQDFGRLMANARRLLDDQPLRSPSQMQEDLAAVDPVSLGDLVTNALPSAVAFVPEECNVELDGLPRRDDDLDEANDNPVDGRTFTRKVATIAPLRLRVIIGDEGLTQWIWEEVSTVHWPDVVGLGIIEDVRELVTTDGRTVLILGRHLREGEELLAMIDARVPASLEFPLSKDWMDRYSD